MALRNALTAVVLLLLVPQAATLRKQNPNSLDRPEVNTAHPGRTLQSLRDELAREVGNARATLGITNPLAKASRKDEDWPVCSGTCPMHELAVGTLVEPAGSTRCLKGAKYKFQVFPGSPEKLYIHMQGGGACWNEATCVSMPTAQDEVKVAEPAFYNPCGDSIFSGYTVVIVADCSGDLYVGDTERPWEHGGTQIEQRGYRNFRAALNWVKQNMAAQLSHLALSGSSAGSVGLQLWAQTLLTELKHQTAQVMTDSYVGIMPSSFQTQLFKDLHVCDSELLRESALHSRCKEGRLKLADIFSATIKAFPKVQFSTLSSKHDGAQIIYHNVALMSMQLEAAAQHCGNTSPETCQLDLSSEVFVTEEMIDPEGFHSRVLEVVEGYNKHSNYVSYLASGNSHDFVTHLGGTCPSVDYDVWAGGAFATKLQKLNMRDWAEEFFSDRRPKHSHCESLEDDDPDDYCRVAQSQKTIQ